MTLENVVSSFLYNGVYIVVVQENAEIYVADLREVAYDEIDNTQGLTWHRVN